jgi:hypothetical protein
LQNGQFKIDPIKLTRGNYGRIDAQAQVAMNNLRRIYAGINFTAFPIDIPPAGVSVQLFGGAVPTSDEEQNQTPQPITIFLPDAKSKDAGARIVRANGNFNLRTVVSIQSQKDANGRQTMQPVGEVRSRATLRSRMLQLTEVNGNLFGGTLSAGGVTDITDLDHIFHNTHIYLAWDKLQSDLMVRLYPGIKGFGGTYSGQAQFQPSTDPRALEPLAIDVYSQSAGGHWRTVQVGNAEVHALMGAHRLIADSLKPSLLHIGGGAMEFWFSSSGHIDTTPLPGGREQIVGTTVSNQLNITLLALQTDQFVKAFDPTHAAGFGLLGGRIFMLSAPKTKTLLEATSATTASTTRSIAQSQEDTLQHLLHSTTVDGNIEIADSDLGNFGPISFLYNAMHLGGNIRKPTGHGTVSFHMEDGGMHISHMYYFNRGIEVRGVATVDQMWKFPDSPLHGSVVGTARPLKNIKFPLFAEADAIFSALQGTLTSVNFDNTVRSPGNYQLVSLAQLGSELKGILLGEIGGGQ